MSPAQGLTGTGVFRDTVGGSGVTTAIHLSLLAFIWLAGILIISPAGEFALNDDWVYTISVKRLLEEGQFRPPNSSSVHFTQAFWGVLFAKAFGFTHEVLRWSTLVAGFAGTVGCYFLMGEMHPSRRLALLAALVFALNPLFFGLSFSFMNDIPFCGLFVPAVLFSVRFLKYDRPSDYVLTVVFSTAAVLCRQLGLCLPLAFLLCLWLNRGFGWRQAVLAVLPLVMAGGAYLFLNLWMKTHSLAPAHYSDRETEIAALMMNPALFARTVVKNLILTCLYLGLFSLPIAILALAELRRALSGVFERRLVWAGAGLFIAAALGLMLFAHRVMPLTGNVLNTTGFGPLLLRDTNILKLPHVETLPSWIPALWTVGALAGGTLLASFLTGPLVSAINAGWRAAVPPRCSREQTAVAMMLMACASYLLVVILLPDLFDRYFVPLIPLVLACLLPFIRPAPVKTGWSRWPQALSAAVVFIFGGFAVLSTHDYLAWNRSRGEMLNHLISVEKIDGGFEFNALRFYDEGYVSSPDKSWWWVQDDTYVLSFGPLPGYTQVGQRAFSRWLPAKAGFVYALRKSSPSLTVPLAASQPWVKR